ncbi:MAG TPA: hypothetical protein DCW74_06635 [Alteromonas australica]|uniref:Uncharacterized protein n=1 Tax=Alteromonas australica TaxID=589873 RepID=A0A350P280_9ALTE|nr:hypothetical protein [Alteromonas australica]
MSNEENREVEILHNGQVIGVALEAVNPTVKTHETSVRLADFRAMFTRAEMTAIYTAANTDVEVKMFLDDISAMKTVSVVNQVIIDDVNYLKDQSLITADRASEILLGKPI